MKKIIILIGILVLYSNLVLGVTGGNITIDGDFTVHTFKVNGTFDTEGSTLSDVTFLIVGGGGAGGSSSGSGGGGGGGGGLIFNGSEITLSPGSYPVVVGLGGFGVTAATGPDGEDSSFNGQTAIGGGGGGGNNIVGQDGGSGGGGGAGSTGEPLGGSGTAGQGFDGGQAYSATNPYRGGGGGGASENGITAEAGIRGDGGDGLNFTINGSNIFYAGGGGGGSRGLPEGLGGAGGGANGSQLGVAGEHAVNGTGGGGGGDSSIKSGNGGSGIVIIRYVTNPAPANQSFSVSLFRPQDNTNNNTPTVDFTANILKIGVLMQNCSLFTNETGSFIEEKSVNVSEFCFQETANISTPCGGLNSGTYHFAGSVTSPNLAIDGNYSSNASTQNHLLGNVSINYTKPSFSTNESLWEFQTGSAGTLNRSNITIPNICWSQSPLQLRVTLDKLCGISTCASNILSCYNGTNFQEMMSRTGTGAAFLSDEAIHWAFPNPTAVNISHTLPSDGDYLWNFQCTDNLSNSSFAPNNFTFTLDTVNPVLDATTFANFSTFFNLNLTGQFNFSDANLIHSVNISIDNSIVVFVNESIDKPTFSVDISQNVTALSKGNHLLNLRVADGHTAKKLKDKNQWNPRSGIFNNHMEYKFRGKYTPLDLKISIEDDSIFDRWEYKVKKDRYSEIVKPNKPSSTQTFLVESTMPMSIVKKKGIYGGQWLIIDEHWKDFVLKNEPDARIEYITLLDDYTARVKIVNINNNINRLEFESTGDLNVVNIQYNFTVANVTETFSNSILNGFSTNFIFDLTEGFIDEISNITLQWNNTNFTSSSLTIKNSSLVRYTQSITPNLNITNTTTIKHQWFMIFNSSISNATDFTKPQNQTLININVSKCEGANIYPILNISYFDETQQNVSISPSNAYDLTISDGTFFYNQTGLFTPSENHTFCTNINPNTFNYTWTMWGSIELNLDDYETRFFNIPSGAPLILSNSPTTNLTIFMIPSSNATTVEYTWTTSAFQPIDGTMNVFRCNADGSQSLTDSPVIVSGRAVSSIELLNALYRYTVTIGSTTFAQPSFSTCHPESSTSLTFRVNTGLINVVPAVGLLLTDCSLTKVDNNTVNLQWGTNDKSDSTITGCVTARKNTIYGISTVLQNCSNTSNFDTSFSETDSYFVNAQLTQDGITVSCENVISFFTQTGTQKLLGNAGIYASLLLIMGLILLFVGEGKGYMGAAGLGIIGAWILGILAFNWIIVSSLIAFIVIITIIGKQATK